MATKVEEGIAECQAVLGADATPHEGLRDYQGVNLEDPAKSAVQRRLAARDRRADLLKAHIVTGEALMADGYPQMPVVKVSAAAYADLKANKESIAAAYAEFTPDALDDLGLTAEPIDK